MSTGYRRRWWPISIGVLLLLLLLLAALFLREHRAPVAASTSPVARASEAADPVSALPAQASVAAAGAQATEPNARVSRLSANRAPAVQRSRAEIMAAMRAADRLPAEDLLLAGKSVDAYGLRAVMQAEDEQFAQMLDEMQRQMMADPLASDVDHMYRSGIEQAMHDHPDVGNGTPTLERFVCGLRLCAGALGGIPDGVDPDDWWNDSVVGHSGLPTYVNALVPATDSNGAPQYRFVFSTDPSSNAVVFTLPTVLPDTDP